MNQIFQQEVGAAAADLTVDEVFTQYGDMVYRLAFVRTQNRHDADDILQDVFIRYIKSAPVFHGEEHRKAWLIRTTINRTKSLLSSAWFRKTTAFEDDLRTELCEKSEVYYAVMQLSPKYRTVIHLFYYENYAVMEIAGILSTKEATIRSQLYRARNQLREILKGAYEDV